MAEEKKYTGPEKAAIFLMSLGEEGAAKILAEMEEREIQSIGNYMSAIGEVEMTTIDEVSREFYKNMAVGGGGLGISGLDFLRTTLMRALDPAKATEILNNITAPGEDLGGGLDTVRMLEPKVIALFLTDFPEHQLNTLIVDLQNIFVGEAEVAYFVGEIRIYLIHGREDGRLGGTVDGSHDLGGGFHAPHYTTGHSSGGAEFGL